MKLTFRTIKGTTFNVDAEPTTTVGDLKAGVESAQGPQFPKDHMKLVYKGKVLDDEAKAISEYQVDESGFLVVFIQKKAEPKPAPAAATGATTSTPAAAAPTPETPSEMQVDTPAAATATTPPAAAPAAATPEAPAAGAAADSSDPYSTAASHLLSGAALEQAVTSMCEMGFPREDVMRAMRAAYNNPERAVEYLMSGIPENVAPRVPPGHPPAAGVAAVPATGGGGPAGPAAAGGAGVAGAPGAAGGGAGPPAPQAFDMFGGGGGGGGGGGAAAGAGAGGEGAAAAGPLDFLRGNPQFQLLRRAVQANPDILGPMLQELRKHNPQLMQQISQHQQEFMRMVMEAPEEGQDDEMAQMAQLLGAMGGGGGEAGGLPPGMVQIELSEADQAAIERLQGLGFERDACIEAYLACDRNEEIAANFLLEGGFGGD